MSKDYQEEAEQEIKRFCEGECDHMKASEKLKLLSRRDADEKMLLKHQKAELEAAKSDLEAAKSNLEEDKSNLERETRRLQGDLQALQEQSRNGARKFRWIMTGAILGFLLG